MPVPDGEQHRVLYVDGIWLARDLVVLVYRSDERVVSWYTPAQRRRTPGSRGAALVLFLLNSQ